jgi:hypothetical protein
MMFARWQGPQRSGVPYQPGTDRVDRRKSIGMAPDKI